MFPELYQLYQEVYEVFCYESQLVLARVSKCNVSVPDA